MNTEQSQYHVFTEEFLNQFESLKQDLIDILTRGENYKTAIEEYRRSKKALEHVQRERILKRAPLIKQYCVYLPYNNVLYSYVLYAIVPSLLANQVFVRPAFLSAGVAVAIHDLLIKKLEGNISLRPWSRSEFLTAIVPQSQVVAFTGKYSNLPEVTSSIRNDQLLIYGGDGLVSFIVHRDADIEMAVEGAIFDRLYASGQDCICPDLFLGVVK